MSSAPPITDASVYADLAGLSQLKRAARNHDPGALRQVAKQFESLFARMLIKSMRDAIGPDPIFGSDQEKMYQGMYDDQLSIELTKGRGLGLADMLVRQMQRMQGDRNDSADGTGTAGGAPGAHKTSGLTMSRPAAASAGATPGSTPRWPINWRTASGAPKSTTQAARATRTAQAAPSASPSHTISQTTRQSFIRELWPQAEQAARQLGVDARNLIAQAALETGWGTKVPQDAQGRSSHNLFGIKGGGTWSGADVTAATHEFVRGEPTTTSASFRSYASRAQCFQDYVALLRGDPRYAAALGTGGDTRAFATALQRGGYATDPQYADKICAIAAQLSSTAAGTGAGARPLKLAAGVPITPTRDTL